MKRIAVLAFVIGAGVSAGFSSASAPPRWVPSELATTSGYADAGSSATAINARGEILGERGRSGLTSPLMPGRCRDEQPLRAFVWHAGRTTDLGTLGGRQTLAVAIDDRGDVIGTSDTRTCEVHGFIWRNGKMIDLGGLGGRPRCFGCPVTDPRAINDKGQVVGTSVTRSGSSHAFLWQDGRMTDLGTLGGPSSDAVDVNERGQIVGSADTATRGQSHAVVWQGGKIADLGTLGGTSSTAVAIDDRGEIIGQSATGKPPHLPGGKPFLWQDGRMIALHPLTADVVAISDRGQIIGDSAPRGPGLDHAVVWQNGRLLDLGRGDAVAVDERGEVVGDNDPIGDVEVNQRALLWRNGQRIVLGRGSALGINPQGTAVVGELSGRAVVWRRK